MMYYIAKNLREMMLEIQITSTQGNTSPFGQLKIEVDGAWVAGSNDGGIGYGY